MSELVLYVTMLTKAGPHEPPCWLWRSTEEAGWGETKRRWQGGRVGVIVGVFSLSGGKFLWATLHLRDPIRKSLTLYKLARLFISSWRNTAKGRAEDEVCLCWCICGPQSSHVGSRQGSFALCEPGPQVRGQRSQSYWRRSVSHVNQLVENTQQWNYQFQLWPARLLQPDVLWKTSPSALSSHHMPWFPKWKEDWRVGDLGGWGSLCIMKMAAYQKLTSSSPIFTLPALLTHSGKGADGVYVGGKGNHFHFYQLISFIAYKIPE